MKVRIKFSKTGPVKFLGHLDTMRYFQKAIRRAALPVAFSEGFSPHMLMTFAAPLGVGMETLGDYFDLELAKEMPLEEITAGLDAQMAEGFHVLKTEETQEGRRNNAMSLVYAADYYVTFRPGKEPSDNWQDQLEDFYSQEKIPVVKQTKTQEKEVDIRPFIYEFRKKDRGVFMKLASASANYTRPDTVLDAFCRYLGQEPKQYAYQILRLETYLESKA